MGQSPAWREPTAAVETARRLLTWFTGAVAAGALLVLAIQVATGVEGASEALMVMLLLVGSLLVVAARRDRRPSLPTDRPLVASTAAAIDALDRVEHRRLELGRPWPQLVVGPTGVSIVDICLGLAPLHRTSAGVPTAAAHGCERCLATRAAADRARQLLAGVEDGRHVPVRVLAVLPPGVAVCAGAEAVDAVPADRLSDTLVRGPVLPMALVDRAFTRLASLAGALVDH